MSSSETNKLQATNPEILLNRYRVLRRLAQGGFGAVCVCWDTRLQRRVAIKRIPLEENGLTTAEEALSEARTACMLAHPNIVAVHDFEVLDSYAYLIMEYIDGLNLSQFLARVEDGMLTYNEAAHVLQSIGSALAFAHENGVLHLDIKPTNIMIDREGRVKLMDFGMANLTSAAGYGGARGGTVGYMAPEQIDGELVDERTDLFALATLMWFALTGENPFAASSAEASERLIYKGLKQAKQSFQDSCADINPFVEPELTEAMSAQPAFRSASVEQFVTNCVPALGDPTEGQASLKDLLEEAESGEEPEPLSLKDRYLPQQRRIVTSVIFRIFTALVVMAPIRLVFAFYQGATMQFIMVGTLVCMAVSAALPTLGAPLVIAALCGALAAGGAGDATQAQVPLQILICSVIVIASLAWWVIAGKRYKTSTLALLSGCCIPAGFAPGQLSTYEMDLKPALLTAVVGLLLGDFYRAVILAQGSFMQALPLLQQSIGQPGWFIMLTATVVAVVASLLVQHSWHAGTYKQRALLAHIFSSGIVLAGLCLRAGVENGGIWASPDPQQLLFAVLLCVLLCIAAGLREPTKTRIDFE